MNLEPFHDLPFNVEMTEDKDNKVVQLAPNGKKPFLGKDKHTIDFLPFRDPKYPTGINCNYYKEYKMFLCVLDIDDPLKYDSPIYKSLEYKDTFTRPSKNGLHVYMWSKKPLSLYSNWQYKDGSKFLVDYRGCTVANPESWGHHVRYYNEFESNCLEVEVFDIDEVVTDFLSKNNCIIRKQGESTINGVLHEPIENIEPNDYIKALVYYFYYRIMDETGLKTWESGHGLYPKAHDYGLKLGGYLENKENASAFCNFLMELTQHPSESWRREWCKSFMVGYSRSDHRKANNFGGKPLSKNEVFKLKLLNLSIEEYAKKLCKNSLHSYLNVIKFKI